MSDAPQAALDNLLADCRIHDLAVSPSGFAFDPRSGQSFTVNATGMLVLDWLRRGTSLAEVARQLTEGYEIAEDVALGAVEVFVRQLARCLP